MNNEIVQVKGHSILVEGYVFKPVISESEGIGKCVRCGEQGKVSDFDRECAR